MGRYTFFWKKIKKIDDFFLFVTLKTQAKTPTLTTSTLHIFSAKQKMSSKIGPLLCLGCMYNIPL